MELIINNEKFEYFSEYTIDLKFAAIASAFSFAGLKDFLPDISDYTEIKVMDGSDLILTGTIVNQSNVVSAMPQLIIASGYSLPGVLEDTNIVGNLQSDNLTLKEIIDKVLQPYGLSYVNETDLSKKYDKSVAEVTSTPKEYLNGLCSQQNIIMSHNENGEVVFTKLNVDELKPVVSISDNSELTKMELIRNGQAMHSEITVIRQASIKNPDAGQFTISNPYCNAYRPKTKILNSGDIFSVSDAARNELSSELTNITLIIDTLLFIKPGNLIEVQSDLLNIKKSKWFVEQTKIKGTVSSETYTLTCVLSDVYSQNDVKNVLS